MFGKKHTAINNLFWHFNVKKKRLKNQNINNFVNAQLAYIKIYSKKLIQSEIINEIKILKKFYFAWNEQIAQYFIMLKHFKNISYLIFYKWKKHALQFVVQNNHFF